MADALFPSHLLKIIALYEKGKGEYFKYTTSVMQSRHQVLREFGSGLVGMYLASVEICG